MQWTVEEVSYKTLGLELELVGAIIASMLSKTNSMGKSSRDIRTIKICVFHKYILEKRSASRLLSLGPG